MAKECYLCDHFDEDWNACDCPGVCCADAILAACEVEDKE